MADAMHEGRGKMTSMQAVMIHPSILAERRRSDEDRRDEVWEGVLHMAPQPTNEHQGIGTRLVRILGPFADNRGWEIRYETGLYDPTAGDSNYRVPDVMLYERQHESVRGVDGRAELVVEILSPHDESRAKLPFYAKHGVQEVWLIEPSTRVIEVYTLRGGTYFAVAADAGIVRSPLLAIELATVDGPKLRVNEQLI